VSAVAARRVAATPDGFRFAERTAAEIAARYVELDDRAFVAGVAGLTGVLLLVLGIGCGLAAVLAHLAWALPAGELLSRPSLLPGALLSLVGGFLIRLSR